MSARKAKSQSSTLLNRIIWLAFALFLMVGLLGLGTVYLRHQTASLANENKALYANISEQKRKLAELGAVIARETTRDELKRLNTSLGLGLRLPEDRQIVHVIEDPMKRLYEKQTKGVLTVSSF